MKIKKPSLKLKLTLSYILIIFISFGFIAYFLDKNLEENALQDIKTSLINQAYLIESQIAPDIIKKEEITNLDSLIKTLASKIKCRITVINKRGEVLADSEKPLEDISKLENHASRPEVKAAFNGKIGQEIRYSSTLKIDMLYIALPLKDKTNVIIGSTRLAIPLENVKKILFTIRKTILISLLFALGLAFVIGSVLAMEIIRPINRIIRVSRMFSEGDFSRRIFQNSSDEIGELAAVLNRMAQDIEDKIKQIEIQNQQLRAIFQSMIEGIILVDNNNQIISVNSTIEKIFNIVKEQARGRLFLEVIRNNDIEGIIRDALKKGEYISKELILSWPVQRTFQVNATPIFEKGEISGCLLVIHDITEIRKLETMRRDFVANVSHELKTPLTSIKGFIETLLEGAVDDKENSRNFLKIIQEHANRLEALVSDLLSLSNLESSTATLKKETIYLNKMAERAALQFKSLLDNRSIAFKNELAGALSISADKDKIEQVFTNLIDNAVKFNRENGLIKIYSQDANGVIKIIIEDSGIGIPPGDIPRIFERFYRVDKARSRSLGGTGLGLSIVKHIVELHGGNVGVESTEGIGSKFWFTLPK